MSAEINQTVLAVTTLKLTVEGTAAVNLSSVGIAAGIYPLMARYGGYANDAIEKGGKCGEVVALVIPHS